MARIRTIKPQAFRSLSLAKVSRDARWLFAGIWTECDDDGRMVDHARLIRTALLPMDDVTDEEVEGWLADLSAVGAICRYGDHLHVPAWSEHQKINRPTPSKLPECPTCRGVPEQGALPLLTPVPGITNPRRCPAHQSGAAMPCGACKEARAAYEDARRDRPTLSAKTTMCGEHPKHPALHCPECAAIPPTAAPAGWRDRKATS